MKLIFPQALEGADLEVTARLFSQLAEAHVGIAGTCEHGSSEQTRNMRAAETNVERGYEGEDKVLSRQPCSQSALSSQVILSSNLLTIHSLRETSGPVWHVGVFGNEKSTCKMEE